MGIKQFFKKFAKGFRKVFNRIFGEGALSALGLAALELFKSELGRIALAVVTELQFENLTSAEKRNAAIDRIKEQAKESGLEYTEGFIRLLIEVAVNRLKSDEG